MRTRVAAVSIALALGAVACEPEPPPGEEPAGLAAAPVAVTEVRVVAGESSAGPFAPDAPIAAVVETRGVAESATLVAVWRDAAGRTLTESSRSITPRGSQSTEFHVGRPGGWPPGEYVVEVWLDGARAARKPFRVEARQGS